MNKLKLLLLLPFLTLVGCSNQASTQTEKETHYTIYCTQSSVCHSYFKSFSKMESDLKDVNVISLNMCEITTGNRTHQHYCVIYTYRNI